MFHLVHAFLENLDDARKNLDRLLNKGSTSSTDYDGGRHRPDPMVYVVKSKEPLPEKCMPPVSQDIDNAMQSSLAFHETQPASAEAHCETAAHTIDDSQSTVPQHAAANLSFSRDSLSRLKNQVETRLGYPLTSAEGMVNLLLSQQLLLSKQSEQIRVLSGEVAQLRQSMKLSDRLGTEVHADLKPAENIAEYMAVRQTSE